MAGPDVLPPELEERLAALESGREAGSDFDGRSAFWLALLGIILPFVLLVIGWFAA